MVSFNEQSKGHLNAARHLFQLLIAVTLQYGASSQISKGGTSFKKPIQTWRGQHKNNSGYTAKNTIQQLQGARNIDVYVSSLG